MKELLRCRAMESMCRQRASFYSEESWKFLAQAEMWRHRALELIAAHYAECNQTQELAATSDSIARVSHTAH